MRKKIRGFTLIELLVVIAIIALLISILLPSLSRARELSKRLVCMSNIKGFGTSCKIYANDNAELWPIPAYDGGMLIDESMVEYTMDNYSDSTGQHAGQVGFDREEESYSVGSDASTQVSVTRAFWMLVRAGNVTVKQFTCPSSPDFPDPTENLTIYYDFSDYSNISYGYQVPFGPRDTAPREGMDNRQALAADKGPWYRTPQPLPDWMAPDDNLLTTEHSPKDWRPYNSPNHGGRGSGEGQNTLFADGHATFGRTPAIGIDNDNIFTFMEFDWTNYPTNIIHGFLPTEVEQSPYPGQEALGTDFQLSYSSTDSLIYP